jgi:hypothetical protein
MTMNDGGLAGRKEETAQRTLGAPGSLIRRRGSYAPAKN